MPSRLIHEAYGTFISCACSSGCISVLAKILLSDMALLDPVHSIGFLFLKVVKVWDFDSGKHLFEFGNAHGDSAITCLTFDPSGRRWVSQCQHWNSKILLVQVQAQE